MSVVHPGRFLHGPDEKSGHGLDVGMVEKVMASVGAAWRWARGARGERRRRRAIWKSRWNDGTSDKQVSLRIRTEGKECIFGEKESTRNLQGGGDCLVGGHYLEIQTYN
jgi:hypothetical protein